MENYLQQRAWLGVRPFTPYSSLFKMLLPVSIVTGYPKADIFLICGAMIGKGKLSMWLFCSSSTVRGRRDWKRRCLEGWFNEGGMW